jgi:hypothetical protein
MAEIFERLEVEHAKIREVVETLLPRVARRPVSRLALEETLHMLDTRLAVHEREEERLFKGAAPELLAKVHAAHEHIEKGRGLLRNGLANWDLPGATGALAAVDREAMGAQAEEVLRTVLAQFAHEERLVAALERPKPKAPAKAAEPPAKPPAQTAQA